MKTFMTILALITLTNSVAGAQTTAPETDHESLQCSHLCLGAALRERSKRWTWSFTPFYFSDRNTGPNNSFVRGGFAEPNKDRYGMKFEFLHTSDRHLQLAIQLATVSVDEKSGNNQAKVDHGRWGAYVGYELLSSRRVHLSLGSGIGFSESSVEVFSTPLNGRMTERAFYIEPSVRVYTRVSDYVSVGVQGSYVTTFGPNSSVVGQDLAVRSPSPEGLSVGAMIIFGYGS